MEKFPAKTWPVKSFPVKTLASEAPRGQVTTGNIFTDKVHQHCDVEFGSGSEGDGPDAKKLYFAPLNYPIKDQ
jgi:hypothetical protein